MTFTTPSINFTSALNYFTSLSNTPTNNNKMATVDVVYGSQQFTEGYNGNGNNGGDYTEKPVSHSTDSSKNGSHKVTYEDPDADVSLRSSDGRIFKVESYVLKTHSYVPSTISTLVHSLYLYIICITPSPGCSHLILHWLALTLSSFFRTKFKQEGIPTSPIQINAATKTLKSLLDIMHMRPVPSGMVWAYKSKLLNLCDELGTPSVAERAVFSMYENVHKDPWGVFTLASQRGNLSLARAALKCLGDHEGGHQIDRLTPQMAAGVTLPYLLGLFNAALKVGSGGHGELDGHGHGHEHGKVGWKSIAENFSPVVG